MTKRMIQTVRWAVTGIVLVGSGCSFRGPVPFYGRILSVSAPSEGSVGQPLGITATAELQGDFQAPRLSAVLASDRPNAVMLRAAADTAPPFMGLGIFANPNGKRRVQVQASIVLQQPGTYSIESVPYFPDEPSISNSVMIK